MKEWIICAAIYWGDDKIRQHQPKNITTGLVVCGRRHHNCFVLLHEIGEIDWTEGYTREGAKVTQGFMTSSDRFVNREEAADIAFKGGQIDKECSVLFSEDLY